MENEKIFEFMEKMYIDLKSKISGVKDEVSSIKQELSEVKTEVKKTNMVIKNEIKPKIEALFDGYKQNTEQITRIEAKVDYVANKVAKNEMDIKVLQVVHSKNNEHRGY